MRSAISLILSGEHGYPDPEIEAQIDLAACVTLRDNARSEQEYMEWDSNVSQALVEVQYAKLEKDDPCLNGEHCRHMWCRNDDDMCCWCGTEMRTREGGE